MENVVKMEDIFVNGTVVIKRVTISGTKGFMKFINDGMEKYKSDIILKDERDTLMLMWIWVLEKDSLALEKKFQDMVDVYSKSQEKSKEGLKENKSIYYFSIIDKNLKIKKIYEKDLSIDALEKIMKGGYIFLSTKFSVIEELRDKLAYYKAYDDMLLANENTYY